MQRLLQVAQPRQRFVLAPTLALMMLAACGRTSTQAPTLARTQAPTQGVTPAACDPATQWRPPASNVGLDDLAMVAPAEGWAVGALTGQWPSASPDQEPAGVIYHLTNGQWQRLPQTYPGAELSTISMDSPNDGWAASSSAVTGTGNRVLVLHYSGGRWQAVDVPALDAVLEGQTGTSGNYIGWISVQMFGPDAGWMFACTNQPRDPNNPASRSESLILRYEHGVWTPIAAPNVSVTTELFGLSAVSANEAWIVGTDYSDVHTVFAYYQNGAWSVLPQTFPGVTEHFTMLSPSDGWAVDDNTGPALLLQYDGTAWAQVSTPLAWAAQQQDVALLTTVIAVSPGDLWFPATKGSFSHATSLFEQHAGGQWRQIDWPYTDVLPRGLVSVGPGELVGIGDVVHQEGCAPALVTIIPQGVFLHYQQGTWSRDVLP